MNTTSSHSRTRNDQSLEVPSGIEASSHAVAQSCTLPYRGFAIRRARKGFKAVESINDSGIARRFMGRLDFQFWRRIKTLKCSRRRKETLAFSRLNGVRFLTLAATRFMESLHFFLKRIGTMNQCPAGFMERNDVLPTASRRYSRLKICATAPGLFPQEVSGDSL